MAEIALSGVSKRFGQTLAVADLSLTIADGELVVLLGPTGAGKTTTLRLIAGLEAPEKGSISIDGRDVTRADPAVRDVTFVFQQYSLYPHLSVYDNLAFPLRSPARRVPEAEIAKRIEAVAGVLGIASKLKNRATALSGRRDAARRHRPRAGAPSVRLSDGRAPLLARRQAARRSQARAEAHPAGPRRHHLLRHARPDRGDDHGEPHRHPRSGPAHPDRHAARDLRDAASVYVAARLGQPRINLIPTGLLPDGGAPSAARTIGARTEHFRIAKATNGKSHATVDWVEHLGDQSHLHVSVGEHKLTTLVEAHTELRSGDAVTVELVDPLYFDQSGNRIGTAS